MQDENSFVNLERGRWNLKNHETLEKLIAEYRNTNSYIGTIAKIERSFTGGDG